MAWLRIDDGFTKHPKLAGWKPGQKWALLELMEYCARYETRGRIPDDLELLPRSITPAFLDLCERCGWVDRNSDGTREVHDWDFYNPPRSNSDEIDERVRELLERNPQATANDAHRVLGGRRKDVLEAFKRYHTGTTPVPKPVPGNHPGTGSSRAHASAGTRARPVPSPTTGGEERPLGATPPRRRDQPAESAERSPASPSDGRSVDPDEWFADEPGKRKAKTSDVVGDKKRPFNRAAAEKFVRQSAYLDPHPADALKAQYAEIPDDDLIELVELALSLANEGAAA